MRDKMSGSPLGRTFRIAPREEGRSGRPSFDLQGETFGQLSVIAKTGRTQKTVQWLCQCSCGTEHTTSTGNLMKGLVTSCGCLQRRITSERSKTHGEGTKATETTEHRIWRAMLRRCRNAKCAAFKDYGGRGITVCERWLQFSAFLEDMGRRPQGKTLDRENNNGNYEPANCRWADRKTQAINSRHARMFTVNDRTMCLRDWSRETGIPPSTIKRRLGRGLSFPEAIGL